MLGVLTFLPECVCGADAYVLLLFFAVFVCVFRGEGENHSVLPLLDSGFWVVANCRLHSFSLGYSSSTWIVSGV